MQCIFVAAAANLHKGWQKRKMHLTYQQALKTDGRWVQIDQYQCDEALDIL